jgi:hypothetical protein
VSTRKIVHTRRVHPAGAGTGAVVLPGPTGTGREEGPFSQREDVGRFWQRALARKPNCLPFLTTLLKNDLMELEKVPRES